MALPGVTIDGPLTAGSRGYPYSASIVDLEPYGYEELDYILSGTATPFMPAPGTELAADGHWKVVAGDAQPYRTRIMVRRPPAERFNGTVIVEFMQEYFGTERDTNFRWNAEAMLREGFAWVGASLHHEGVDGPSGVEVEFGDFSLQTGPTLAAWDPERYGSLSIPHSDLCYAILSDVARVVGARRASHNVDPMAGLSVEHVIGAGNTIAAVRLAHYINAVHHVDHVFDGFYLQDLTEIGLPLAEGTKPPVNAWVRADADVPVIIMNTMTAAMEGPPRPDGGNVRLWEPAGSSHTTGPYMERVAAATKRDTGAETPICPPDVANTFPVQYVSAAALLALHRWIGGGTAAPSFPPLDRTSTPDGWTEIRDAVGNCSGGLRTPWVDVPVARYEWRGDCLGGAGLTHRLTAEELTALYGTPEAFRERFEASVQAAQERGVLLRDDARQAMVDASLVTW